MGRIVGQLHIAKRTASEWLVVYVFFLPFVQAFLSEFIGLPDIIKFSADAAIIILLIKVFMICKNVPISRQFSPFLVLIGAFFAFVTVAYFFNYQSLFYYIWGLRNYFRFYVAFIAYAVLLKWSDAKKWLKLLDWLYVLNFFVVLAQFLMGHRQDYLGGLFGVQKGCNGGLLTFLTAVLAKTVLAFMRNEQSTMKCLIFTVMGLWISALAELKFFFVIFICITVMAMIMTKSSAKKTLFLVICIVLITVFSSLLSLMYDEFSNFLSLESLWNSLINSNYATKEDIGRLTAIPTISEYFLTDWPERLFGMGLGNADTSSLAIFNTPFFEMYGSLHYSFMSYAFLYLETGIVGLILYSAFFGISFTVALKLYRARKADEACCQLTMIFSVMCFIFMFYNSALRTETAGYFAFFILALPLLSSGAGTAGER